MRGVFVFSLLLFFIGPAYSLECPKSFTPKKIARELLKLEFSGVRLKKNKCLTQKKHRYVRVVEDFTSEDAAKSQGTIKSIDDIHILKVELINPRTYSYKVDYKTKVKSKEVVDSMVFFLYKSKKQHQDFGCAAVTIPPKQNLIFSSCTD